MKVLTLVHLRGVREGEPLDGDIPPREVARLLRTGIAGLRQVDIREALASAAVPAAHGRAGTARRMPRGAGTVH